MHERLDRGDVDDPPLGCAQRVKKRMRHIEHAVEIDRHDVLPVLDDGVRIGGESVAAVDAGIVDQDRNLADLAGDLCGDRAAGRPIGDVEREVLRLAAVRADIGCGFRGRFAVDVQHHHLRAFARITERDAAADAGASTGDDGDVVLQKPGHALSSVWIVGGESIANVGLPDPALTSSARPRASGDPVLDSRMRGNERWNVARNARKFS